MTYTVHHFISGKTVSNQSESFSDLHNPATGEVIGRVVLANQNDVNQAVQAAANAFPAWSATPPIQRARILFEYKNLVEQHKDELAAIVTREHGKLLDDAKGSVQRGLELLELVCGIPSLLKGDFSLNVGGGINSYTVRQALGVCVGITPFNFPAMIPLWMFPMAIACGNTFVLKPSEKDPSCAVRLAELMKMAGLPDGVLNVVHGTAEAVNGLITHPKVAAVSFVGSSRVAEHIAQTATAHHKRVQAFGGAKNHALIMPDADMDVVADAVVGAAYGSAGQRCMALSVVVAVGQKTLDALLPRLTSRVQALKLGAGDEKACDFGPLHSAPHLKHVLSLVEQGVQEGARLVVDGRHFSAKNQGYFMGACLFSDVTPTMKIYQEEIFGPVLCVMCAPDFDTALSWVNQHPYGNGSAIFTRDGEMAHTFATQVQTGMVGVNVPIPVPPAYHAFGGWKQSVFSDIGMHGEEGLRFFTRVKTVMTRWPTSAHSKAEFAMPVLK